MAAPNYTFQLVATTVGGESDLPLGICLVKVGDVYLSSTAANRGSRNSSGIAVAPSPVNGATVMQCVGDVAPEISGLGAGTKSPVRVSTTGYLERVESPDGSDDVVGNAEVDGLVHLFFGGVSSGGGGATAPGGEVGQIQFNDTGFGGASKLWANDDGTISIGDSIADAAQSGDVRLEANATIKARRDDDTDDLTVFESVVADGIQALIIGAPFSETTPDATNTYDQIQVFGNNGIALNSRNGENGIEIDATFGGGSLGIYAKKLLSIEGELVELFGETGTAGGGVRYARINQATTDPTSNPANAVYLGLDNSTHYLKYKRPDGSWVILNGAGAASDGDDGTVQTSDGADGFVGATGVLAAPGFVSINPGGNPVPSIGLIRVPKNTPIAAYRNNANSADYVALAQDGDELFLGSSTAYDKQAYFLRLFSQQGGQLGIGSGEYLGWISGEVQIRQRLKMGAPIVGDSSLSNPYGVHGNTPVDMGAADYTLLASEYAKDAVELSNVGSGNALTWPVPASGDSYRKTVINNGSNDVELTKGSGDTATSAAGSQAEFLVTSAGVYGPLGGSGGGGSSSWAGYAATTLDSTDVQGANATGFDYYGLSTHMLKAQRDGYVLDDRSADYTIIHGPTSPIAIPDNSTTVVIADVVVLNSSKQVYGYYRVRCCLITTGSTTVVGDTTLLDFDANSHEGLTSFTEDDAPVIVDGGGYWAVKTNHDSPYDHDARWGGTAVSVSTIY